MDATMIVADVWAVTSVAGVPVRQTGETDRAKPTSRR
jgi:hypothetical protein